uniref:Nicotiana lesion-inducing like n=1 Tax=Zea mays TaxID=4577 RepID=A0A804RK33_MAIZE
PTVPLPDAQPERFRSLTASTWKTDSTRQNSSPSPQSAVSPSPASSSPRSPLPVFQRHRAGRSSVGGEARPRPWALSRSSAGFSSPPSSSSRPTKTKTLKPKFNLFVKLVSKNTGLGVPHIDIKTVIAATMFLKGFGGLLFIVSSSFGAFLLLIYLAFITPIVYDFYNHEMESTLFVDLFFKFIQNLAFMGALLFFLGMKNSIPKRRSKGRTTKTKTN